ncbi:MAG: lipocalin-like domain-containing protein [Simplicispira sp.]|nr:lipocalin-like domain-containing protein [Simplicispira sp.]
MTYDDGRPPRHPFGEDAIGQLIYTEDGQMSVTVVRALGRGWGATRYGGRLCRRWPQHSSQCSTMSGL